MSARSVGSCGEKGGPRTIHKDNTHPGIKTALRRWILKEFSAPSVLDIYGGYGLMWQLVWSKHANDYTASTGEALSWLGAQNALQYNVFDIDPYSSPYEALQIVAEKATGDRIGIVCTDGCLRRQAHMRGRLPKILQQCCNWDWHDKALMTAIYYQYPRFLRFALVRVMKGWEIEALVVKYGKGFGKSSTVYFAAIMKRQAGARKTEQIKGNS